MRNVSVPNSGLDFSTVRDSGIFRKIWFTILVLVLCRLGSYIPIPGVNPDLVSSVISKNVAGVMGIFNLFSGGALGRMTIFALNVMPYIVSSIVVQLCSVSFKSFADIRNSGESGRRKINLYSRCITVFFAVMQSSVILMGLEEANVGTSVVLLPTLLFRVVGGASLVGGTMLLIWLGELINSRGVGNGISLIIFSGIVSEMPNSFASLFVMSKNGGVSFFSLLMILASFFLLLLLVIFVERSFRKVLVQYPKKQVKNKIYASHSTYIPFKINMSGVIPPIFANAIILSPVTIASFSKGSAWADFILSNFSSGRPLYVVLYIASIVFFCFFYTGFVFNSAETADILRKNGGVILGRRPGKATADYFDFVVVRIGVIGSIYLAFVCAVPELMRYYYNIPFSFGGTSLLILVSVIMDTVNQIQTSLFANQYDSLIKSSSKRRKSFA